MIPLKANHGNIIVGLDIGTTKICAVVGEVVEGSLEFLGVSLSPSSGLRKGVVVDIDATVESIKNALKEAESSTGVEIHSVYAGISGGHIKGFESYGAVGIRGKEVSHIDVDRVLESARAVYVPLDREVLHVIPTGYIVDGQNGIKDPVGMFGVRLEANVYIITGAVTSIQNLIRCCEKTGIGVKDLVFEPFASADSILTDYERELGVAVVDIGGGTTDITIFKDGFLRHSSVIAVGGNHFTNDIAIGLRISVSEAERIKRSFGSAIASTVSETEEIDIIQAEKDRKILRRHLAEIIQPRTIELLNMIKDELKSVSGYDIASSGLVITGGGALLQGFDKIAEIVLELPVRIGFPRDIRGCEEIIANPIYATGAGLVLHGFRSETNKSIVMVGVTGIVGKMRDLVKSFFK